MKIMKTGVKTGVISLKIEILVFWNQLHRFLHQFSFWQWKCEVFIIFNFHLTGFCNIFIFYRCVVVYMKFSSFKGTNLPQNCMKNDQWPIKTHFWVHRTIIWTNDPQGSKFCFESLSTIRWFIFRFPPKNRCKNRCNFLWFSSIKRRFTNISILHRLLHRFWLYVHIIVFIGTFVKK